MKIAVLILAHKNFTQLHRLISILQHEDIDIFIHLDKKWKISEKEMNQLISLEKGNVFLTIRRISASIYLWSLVEATMELIYKAKEVEEKNDKKYQYFALLSGQDYPIKPIESLLDLLQKSYPKPFIDCTPYHPKNWLKGKFKTLPFENKVLLYFIKHWKPGILRHLLRIPLKLPLYFLFFVLKIFILSPYKKLTEMHCKLYGGSAWWILPDKAIDVIFKRFNDPNDTEVKYLSRTLSPEETFFQIMVMQTELANLVEVNPVFSTAQNCLTYAHFKDEGKPFTGHPYVFDVNDFGTIMNLPHYFARKFDDALDIEILDLIDNEILAKECYSTSEVI